MNEIMQLIDKAYDRFRHLDRSEYEKITQDEWTDLEQHLLAASRQAFNIGNKQDPTG